MPRGTLQEIKLQAVKDYISGSGSYRSHANIFNLIPFLAGTFDFAGGSAFNIRNYCS